MKLTSCHWRRTERLTSFCTHGLWCSRMFYPEWSCSRISPIWKKMDAPVRICSVTGTIKDCFESFPEALLTLNGHPTILEAVVAFISHDLIRDQRPFATSSEAPQPTRCELLTAKQFSWTLREENVHFYAFFIYGTFAQSCMNDSEESLECLKLEIIEDLTEIFLTELPKTPPSWTFCGSPHWFAAWDKAFLSSPLQTFKQTVRNYFPTPYTDVLIDKTQSCQIFSLLYLLSTYHQVRIFPPDIPTTAFVTPFGHFEYLVVPFGLTDALGISDSD